MNDYGLNKYNEEDRQIIEDFRSAAHSILRDHKDFKGVTFSDVSTGYLSVFVSPTEDATEGMGAALDYRVDKKNLSKGLEDILECLSESWEDYLKNYLKREISMLKDFAKYGTN